MAASLANYNASTLTHEKIHIKRPAMAPFQVPFKTLKASLTVHLPDINVDAEPTTETSESTVEDALTRHSTWKKSVLPWNGISAAKVVLAMRYAFPDLEDAASLAVMAATYVVGCEVDDAVEKMDRQTATDCIRSGVAILDSDSPIEEEEPTNKDLPTMNGDVGYLCRIYFRYIYNTLRPRTAAAVMANMKRFLLGQLGELNYRSSDAKYQDLASYLEVRKESIGMAPLLAIAEHYFLGTLADEKCGVDSILSPFSPLKESMARLCVLQNDIAGLEKDVWTSNSCNSIHVLAGMSGTQIYGSTGLHELEKFLPRLVAEHDKSVMDVVADWEKLLESTASSAEQRLFGTIVLKLTVLHFRWACSARRYKVGQKE